MNSSVQELSYIGIATQDIPAWHNFAVNLLGMMPGATSENGETYRLDNKIHRILVEASDHDDLAFAGYEVASTEELEDIIEKLHANGHKTEEGSAELAAARGVERIVISHDPEGNQVELVLGFADADTPFSSEVNPSGFKTEGIGAGHMFLLSRKSTREQMLDYYALLGFTLSDYIKEKIAPGLEIDGAFTHCNGRHHTLAFAELDAPVALHHLLVEVNDLSVVGRNYDRIIEAGVPLSMTLGMHPNDKMVSFYAVSPSGFSIEYGWGGLIIEDEENWEVTHYDQLSEWGHQDAGALGRALTPLAPVMPGA
ncbi:VOC family protein [Corynebacterium sp. S7]